MQALDAFRAQNAALMLGNAFPAEKAAALEALRSGLAHRMVETTLMNQVHHELRLLLPAGFLERLLGGMRLAHGGPACLQSFPASAAELR